jgi:predicted 3-demethylubiquinone-9 3-methyltransferase (glyoxalase superfamily)
MAVITPCIWCNTHAEEAARFYTSFFPGDTIRSILHYSEGMPLPAGTVLIVDFTIAGRAFQALNGGPRFTVTPSLSFFLEVGTANEVRRLYDRLVEGGKVLMPLDAYPWSPCYAWVQDRFGVSWQVRLGDDAKSQPRVLPSLMFSDAQHGRASDAVAIYTRLFPNSAVQSVAHHAGEASALLAHAGFTLAGEAFVAMDSPIAHGFSFTEGVSLSASCMGQDEVDRLWAALTEGGEPGPCGWLTDRFGVSWQIVPAAVVELQHRGDAAANSRMFQAMGQMKRLDLAALERAWHGEA